ncbi:MAG: AraC family transcriptional regulator [Desulfobacteraceae bacterium]|nr:MAG: AraC family transcriptional regulator [Desulfobacteraceae bacterium]
MNNINYFISLILLCAAFLVFFLALVIFKIKSGTKKANRFIGLYCFATFFFLLRGSLLISGLYSHLPFLTELIDNARYFLGPSLYFYVKLIIDPDYHFKKIDLIHLAPVIVNIVIKMPFYLGTSESQMTILTQWLDSAITQPQYIWDTLSRLLFYVCFCLYLSYALRSAKIYREKIINSSPFGNIYLSWIKIFSHSLVPILILWFTAGFFILMGYSLRYFFYAINLSIAFLVLYCGFNALKKPEIFYSAKALKSQKKYNDSSLSDREVEIYHDKLLTFMEKQEAYLDPDLTLAGLAEEIGLSRNDLSRIINEKQGRSFYDFINTYRVEKIKRLLSDPKRQEETILALAFQAGFNSKATFNSVFKKFTGESPVAYRKNYLN